MRDSDRVSEQLVRTAQESKNGALVSILYSPEEDFYKYIYYSNIGEFRLTIDSDKTIDKQSILRQNKERLKKVVLRMIRFEELDILYLNESYITKQDLLAHNI